MPYLEYLFCEHCGNYAKLDIDPSATIEAYRKDGREQVAIVQPLMVWDYLIYSCGICESKYKYTYKDVEAKVRGYFSSLSNEFKDYFDDAIQKIEDRENNSSPASQQRKVAGRVRDLYTAKK